MRARRVLVHSSLACLSLWCTIRHQLFDFRDALHYAACEVFHIDTPSVGVFFKFQLIVQVLFRIQEISNVFIVNFKVRDSNEKFHLAWARIRALVNEPENVVKSVGDNTSVLRAAVFNAHHSVCFTTAGLTIGKYRAVIALEDRFDERKSTFIIDRTLSWIPIIHRIIRKCFLFSRTFLNDDLIDFFVYLNAEFRA